MEILSFTGKELAMQERSISLFRLQHRSYTWAYAIFELVTEFMFI